MRAICQPVVAVNLVIADDVPHAVAENLRSAARHRVQPSFLQLHQHFARRHLADLGEERNLHHGEALQMHLREALLQPGNHVEVIRERQVGMKSADDVELGHRLGVSGGGGVPNFLQRHGVSAGRILLAAKRAQAARRHANVRVIDVPVDVEVGDVAVHPLAHVVRQPADRQNVARTVQRQRVVFRQPLLRHHLLGDSLQPRIVRLKGMLRLTGECLLYSCHSFNDNAPSRRNHGLVMCSSPANPAPLFALCVAFRPWSFTSFSVFISSLLAS